MSQLINRGVKEDMGKKIYTVLMIVMPIFVGSVALLELIGYFSEKGSTMNPIICALLAIVEWRQASAIF